MIGWIDEHGPGANRQILPDGDFTQTGVRWNKDGYAAPPMIAAPERSGLYYLWMRTPSGKAFSFPWIVAPAKPQTDIAVLASTNTWNAYNNFGGRSNYVNADHLPDAPIVNSRQDLSRYQDASPFGVWKPKDDEFQPLSFDRPEPHNHLFDDPDATDPIQGRVQCGVAPAEWRLYAWLEREGFDYDLVRRGAIARRHTAARSNIACSSLLFIRSTGLATCTWRSNRGCSNAAGV